MPGEVAAVEQTVPCARAASCPGRSKKSATCSPRICPLPGAALPAQSSTSFPAAASTRCMAGTAYFILLGLEAEHREKLAKGIVDNFLFEIEHYGGVLNANRTYYLTRSQPPFLTSMIRAVIEDPASFPATPAGRTAEQAGWSTPTRWPKRTTRPGPAPSTRPASRIWLAIGTTAPGPVPGDGRHQHLLSRHHSRAG